MKELFKYFKTLQSVANIMTSNNIEFCARNGIIFSEYKLLYALDPSLLFTEPRDENAVESLIELNRENCKDEKRISFLDVDETLLERYKERITEKYHDYKRFKEACFDGWSVPAVATDEFVLPRLFKQRKNELVKICRIKIAANPDTHRVDDSLNLPPDLNTERARKYFQRAIDAGFMAKTDSGYKWLFGGNNRSKARLAYFIEKVYCPAVTDLLEAERRRELERLFNTIRLDRAIQQNADTGAAQSVKKWRAKIDEDIFD